jgi:hypothetical protein
MQALEIMADEEQEEEDVERGRDSELYEDSSTPEYASPTASKSTIGKLKVSLLVYLFFHESRTADPDPEA